MFRAVFGYIDPGSGTILLQVLMATLIGAIAFVGKIRQALISLVRSLSGAPWRRNTEDESPPKQETKRQAA